VTVTKNRLYEFVLAADTDLSGLSASMNLRILDALGNVVFTLTANAGRPAVTSHVYLKAGIYVVWLTAADVRLVRVLTPGEEG
jgi:hypothetical protein